jgi:hypothetical protein
MPLDYHTVETVDGATPTNRTDRVILGFLPAVANPAGAEGAAVAVPISGLVLPASYNVQVTPGQACVASVNPTSKGFGGFTVTLTPLSSSQTIAAGSIDILVTA